MKSGFGVPYNIPMKKLMQGVRKVAVPRDAKGIKALMLTMKKMREIRFGLNSTVSPMKSKLMPIKAVFSEGDPSYVKQFAAKDFTTQRWNQSDADKTISPSLQAWSAMKCIEWAKFFHRTDNYGVPEVNFDLHWRMMGIMLDELANEMLEYSETNLKNQDGDFVSARFDGNKLIQNDAVKLRCLADMLMAFSEMCSLVMDARMYPRYVDETKYIKYKNYADDLFLRIINKSLDFEALCQTIVAIPWYLSYAVDRVLEEQAYAYFLDLGNKLRKIQKKDGSFGDLTVNTARAIRALVEIYRISGKEEYKQAAVKAFRYLDSMHNAKLGVYRTKKAEEYDYSSEDIGVFCAALNSFRLFLGTETKGMLNRISIEDKLSMFMDATLNKAGMMLSAPARDEAYPPVPRSESKEDEIRFKGKELPKPQDAKGTNGFGVAPVLAARGKFNVKTKKWEISKRCDVFGAIYTAVEWNWLEERDMNGFPVPQKMGTFYALK